MPFAGAGRGLPGALAARLEPGLYLVEPRHQKKGDRRHGRRGFGDLRSQAGAGTARARRASYTFQPSLIGNTFVSRLRLSNAGADPVAAELIFTPAGEDGFAPGTVKRATVVVPPSDLVNLSEPLVQLFGLTPPLAGPLEVRAPPEKIGLLTITSLVDAPAQGGGTFGFQLPTLIRGEGATSGTPHVISGITATADFRTNLILAETTGRDAASVRAVLFDRGGTRLGDQLVSVPRYGQRQISGVVATLGGTSLEAGRIELNVESGGGAVVGIVTVIDNTNDDAVTYVSRPTSSAPPATRRTRWALAAGTQKLVVPAIVSGFRTFPATDLPYTFRSLMGFTSATAAPASFRLTYKDLESGQAIARTVTVQARQTIEYRNAVEELFGVPSGQRSQGPVLVEADPNGLMYCKVYSNLERGSLGDGFPVIPVPFEALTGGGAAKPIYMDGLEQSIDTTRGTRSNLILNEVTGQETAVTVRLYEAGNRTQPIAERELALQPLEKLQLSTVFAGLGMTTDERRKDRTNVQVVVTAKGGNGMVSAVVTTIDNKTGDTKNSVLTPSGGVPATGGASIGF